MLKVAKKITTSDFWLILTLRTVGNFLIFSSLFFIAKTFYQPLREEVRYFANNRANKQYVVASAEDAPRIQREFSVKTEKGTLASNAQKKTVEVLVPVDPEYSIVVSKIGANAKVQPNVDASNKDSYLEALQNGVAHAEGTAFPGEHGHIFLFAHSTDYIWNVGSYNAVFYLLYKLENGDEVNVFYKGQRYVYRVTGKQVVDPSEVEFLTRKTDKEFLTMQTCWPPGTTLKRMLVFAERVAE